MKELFTQTLTSLIGRPPQNRRDQTDFERAFADLSAFIGDREWNYKALQEFAHSIGARGEVCRGHLCLDSTYNPNLCPCRIMSVWYRNDSPLSFAPLYNQVRIELTDKQLVDYYLGFISGMDTDAKRSAERIAKWEQQQEDSKEAEIERLEKRLRQLKGEEPAEPERPVWKPRGLPSNKDVILALFEAQNDPS